MNHQGSALNTRIEVTSSGAACASYAHAASYGSTCNVSMQNSGFQYDISACLSCFSECSFSWAPRLALMNIVHPKLTPCSKGIRKYIGHAKMKRSEGTHTAAAA